MGRGMLRRLFNRKPRADAPVVTVPAGLPAGKVVWAVGDIHGRLDLLDRLLSAVVDSDQVGDGPIPTLVFLGDYIDRGSQSCGVIDRLVDLADDPAFETHFLKGNHEDKMLEFLEDPSVGAAWCDYGGAQALESFGLKIPVLKHRPEGWTALSSDLAHRLTSRQRAFLESLEYSVSIGGYFFAHAGARPGVPLEDQSDHDLMWVRGSFLNSETRFERVVVHGHTPTDAPHIDHRRIGIDTRAYESGVLTAVRLEGQAHRFLQAVQQADGEISVRPWDVADPA
jgi:serine/threonine protein phosphatase 1